MLPRTFTFVGRAAPVTATLARLPVELQRLLEQINGFVAFAGGLHVRGATAGPVWHSLETVWSGSHALSSLYEEVEAADVPFGQNCMGDQFLLRPVRAWSAGPWRWVVVKLCAETGEVEGLATGLEEFLSLASRDPLTFLSLASVVKLRDRGRPLRPGQILLAHPPYCTQDDDHGIDLRPVPALAGLRLLAALAARLRGGRAAP